MLTLLFCCKKGPNSNKGKILVRVSNRNITQTTQHSLSTTLQEPYKGGLPFLVVRGLEGGVTNWALLSEFMDAILDGEKDCFGLPLRPIGGLDRGEPGS